MRQNPCLRRLCCKYLELVEINSDTLVFVIQVNIRILMVQHKTDHCIFISKGKYQIIKYFSEIVNSLTLLSEDYHVKDVNITSNSWTQKKH